MTKLTRNLQLVIVAVALLATMAVAAVADEDDGGGGTPGANTSQVTTIDPEATEAMEVLDEPRINSDALPADLAEQIDEHADFGMNPDLSRRAIGSASISVYALPAEDRVCVAITVGDGANLSCPSTDQIAAGQVGPGTVGLATGDIAVYGLVPDGVDSISVHTGTDDSTPVTVQDNAYYEVVEAGTPLRSVTYAGPSGPVEFPIYDPAKAFGQTE